MSRQFFTDIERDFRSFHDNLARSVGSAFENVMPRNFGAVDMAEKEKQVLVRMDVPGVSEDNVSVLAGSNDLTISAYRPCFAEELQEEKKPKAFVMWQNDRFCGEYKSSFSLPTEINPKNVTAEVNNGVLFVTADKLVPEHTSCEVTVKRR